MDNAHEIPTSVSINETQEWLWYYLWLENWNNMYCALICMGISFLNFQIYNVLLISSPAFFVTLCAAFGITNLLLVVSIACAAIIGGGVLIGTLTYSILLVNHSLNQILELENDMPFVQIWTNYSSKPSQLIKLLKDENFYKLSRILEGKIISSELQAKLILDIPFRHLVYQLLNKLPINFDNQSIDRVFAQDFHDLLEKRFADELVKHRFNDICSILDLLPALDSPCYDTLRYIFLEEKHQKLLDISKELLIYQSHHLTPIINWKLLDNTQLKNIFKLAKNRLKSHGDIVALLNQIWEFTQAYTHSEIISAEARAESPTLQHAHSYNLKVNSLKKIWNIFHDDVDKLLTIWPLIAKNPQFELIYPLIETCFLNLDDIRLYAYLVPIANIGYFNFNNQTDCGLISIYENNELMPLFLDIIDLLVESDALIEEIFIELLSDVNTIPQIHHIFKLCLKINQTPSKEEINALILSLINLIDAEFSDEFLIEQIDIILKNPVNIEKSSTKSPPNNLTTIREDDSSPYPFGSPR